MLSDETIQKIVAYDWPGNVRELKNFVERLVVMTSKETLEIRDIPDSLFSFSTEEPPKRAATPAEHTVVVNILGHKPKVDDPDFSLSTYLENCERDLTGQVLRQCKSTYKAAEILGVSQATMARLKKKYDIEY